MIRNILTFWLKYAADDILHQFAFFFSYAVLTSAYTLGFF